MGQALGWGGVGSGAPLSGLATRATRCRERRSIRERPAPQSGPSHEDPDRMRWMDARRRKLPASGWVRNGGAGAPALPITDSHTEAQAGAAVPPFRTTVAQDPTPPWRQCLPRSDLPPSPPSCYPFRPSTGCRGSFLARGAVRPLHRQESWPCKRLAAAHGAGPFHSDWMKWLA